MANHIPSPIAGAIRDPKTAPTSVLQAALDFVDDIEPEAYDLMAEEHARRGGDYEYQGYYAPPEYA